MADATAIISEDGKSDICQGDEEAKDYTSSKASSFTPITTQEELDRIVTARLKRERTKYADYDALKKRAEKYDELEVAIKENPEVPEKQSQCPEDKREAIICIIRL